MYIYARDIDAYLCYNKSSHRISFQKLHDTVNSEWENWEETEDERGNKTIIYRFPDGNIKYLYPAGTLDSNTCGFVLWERLYLVFGDEYCCVRENRLVWRYRGSVNVVIPNNTEFHIRCFQENDCLPVKFTDATHVEMMCMLPHCLK